MWALWRLVLDESGGFDYETVFYKMTVPEIEAANIALDMRDAEIKKQMNRKR